MVTSTTWSDDAASNFARQNEPKADYVVITHLKTQAEPWTVDLTKEPFEEMVEAAVRAAVHRAVHPVTVRAGRYTVTSTGQSPIRRP